MSSEHEITLFDLHSKPHRCYSLNTWKTRALLNYKAIPYKTHWIKSTEMQSFFSTTPTLYPLPPGASKYTLPAILLPSTPPTFLLDSATIATTLEPLYPSPPLHLNFDVAERATKAIYALAGPLAPLFLYRFPPLLEDDVAASFTQGRLRDFRAEGKTFEMMREEAGDGEGLWEGAGRSVQGLVDVIESGEGGPLVGGREMTFADLVIVGLWDMFVMVDEGDLLERVLGLDGKGVFRGHFEATRYLLEKNGD